MLFQVLDSNEECLGIFCEGQIREHYKDIELSHTWAPTLHFRNQQLEYAQLWASGKSLQELCPPELKNSYSALDAAARAYLRSFQTARIDLRDVCFYDLVPESFLLDFFQIKNDITKNVFETQARPSNYQFLHDLSFLLMDLRTRELKLDFKKINCVNSTARHGLNKLKKSSNKVVYNPWTTATGRLTTEKDSFPILTLHKDLRSVIKPHNDCFVELDYNAAEVRVLFGLLDQPQPKEDVHEWIGKNIFNDKHNREKTKKKVFSWLYNPNAKNKRLNEYIDRDMIYNKYYENGQVDTPYDRTLQVVEEKALNYLIQSTASDMFLTSATKINNLLQGKKSSVAFCIHDSLVLDFSLEDRPLLEEVCRQFSNTKFGFMRSNLSIGKDFGNMKRVK